MVGSIPSQILFFVVNVVVVVRSLQCKVVSELYLEFVIGRQKGWPVEQSVAYSTANPTTRVRFPVGVVGNFHLGRKSRRSTQPQKMSTGGNPGAKPVEKATQSGRGIAMR